MKVPLVDLFAQYTTIREQIDSAITEAIRTSAFIRGPLVETFEQEYAACLGVRQCISCANGTDALFIALHGLGVGPGDEVIAPAHSWISSSEAITQAGARVVFCDTDPETFTLDPALLEARITGRTRGIVVVHLYGQPADMQPILGIAKRRNLWVLEDCAQAHFARYKEQVVGTFGRVATFSFYPGKNLGAMGDAGCVVTNDARLAQAMRMFARHGGLSKGDHEIEGINSRLDGMQAAILSAKLPNVPAWTEARRRLAATYDRDLAGLEGLRLPFVAPNRDHVFHLYVVRTHWRDGLRDALKRAGIETGIHYPTALPFLKAYTYLGHEPGDFPVAFAHQAQILSLPLYPELTSPMQEHVISTIREFFATVRNPAQISVSTSPARGGGAGE